MFYISMTDSLHKTWLRFLGFIPIFLPDISYSIFFVDLS